MPPKRKRARVSSSSKDNACSDDDMAFDARASRCYDADAIYGTYKGDFSSPSTARPSLIAEVVVAPPESEPVLAPEPDLPLPPEEGELATQDQCEVACSGGAVGNVSISAAWDAPSSSESEEPVVLKEEPQKVAPSSVVEAPAASSSSVAPAKATSGWDAVSSVSEEDLGFVLDKSASGEVEVCDAWGAPLPDAANSEPPAAHHLEPQPVQM